MKANKVHQTQLKPPTCLHVRLEQPHGSVTPVAFHLNDKRFVEERRHFLVGGERHGRS